MLDTYTATSEKYITKTGIEDNWLDLKTELLGLAQYRVDSTNYEWYRDVYINYMFDIESLPLRRASEINKLPQGILAEVFFLNACKQSSIMCEPCCGDEDVMGADFKISHDRETRFFDVSINTEGRSLKKKVQEGTFPTLFLPWRKRYSDYGSIGITYAERYIRCGEFDGRTFLHDVIASNYEMLDCLKRKVWRNEDVERKIFNHEYVDISGSGIHYVNTLEGVLLLIRKSL